MLANGQGVGRIGAQVVFVWGPLPEERALVRVVEVKKTYAVAESLKILERSAERVDPFCPVFGTCGGCQVQHLSYEGQLAWKTRLVREALQRIGKFESPPVRSAIGMDEPRAYRNKMALVVRSTEDRVDFGFYQMRSHDFVPITGCPVVLPQLDETIAALRGVAEEPEYAPLFREVLHAVARAGKATGQMVLTFTTKAPAADLTRVAKAISRRLRGMVGFANSHSPASENAILGRKHRELWGRTEMEEKIALSGGRALRYRISAPSFFQINTEIVSKIFDALGDLAVPMRVVDLYCGAGTFSIWFAVRGASVVGIEENHAAIREARVNAGLNGVQRKTEFLAGRVETLLRRSPGYEALLQAEVAFLDPPRKGCEPQTLDALVDARVPAVWYLSCNPATLARDLAHLRRGGYTLQSVQPFDMFPQTGHVEALVTMRRTESGHAKT